jgi:hypothetical protein
VVSFCSFYRKNPEFLVVFQARDDESAEEMRKSCQQGGLIFLVKEQR